MDNDKKGEIDDTNAQNKIDEKQMVFEFVIDRQKIDPSTVNVKFEKIPSGVRLIIPARCM